MKPLQRSQPFSAHVFRRPLTYMRQAGLASLFNEKWDSTPELHTSTRGSSLKSSVSMGPMRPGVYPISTTKLKGTWSHVLCTCRYNLGSTGLSISQHTFTPLFLDSTLPLKQQWMWSVLCCLLGYGGNHCSSWRKDRTPFSSPESSSSTSPSLSDISRDPFGNSMECPVLPPAAKVYYLGWMSRLWRWWPVSPSNGLVEHPAMLGSGRSLRALCGQQDFS